MNRLELKEFRKKYKLSIQDVADITKASLRAAKSWDSGTRNMSQSAIALLNLYLENLEINHLQEESAAYNRIEPAGIRLAEFAAKEGLSIKEFALKCELNYNNTASLLKGSMPLGIGVLQKIKKGYPSLNSEWVLFGNGSIEINNAPLSVKNTKEVEQLEQLNYLLNNSLKEKDRTISSLENQIALLQELKELKSLDESPVKSNVAK